MSVSTDCYCPHCGWHVEPEVLRQLAGESLTLAFFQGTTDPLEATCPACGGTITIEGNCTLHFSEGDDDDA